MKLVENIVDDIEVKNISFLFYALYVFHAFIIPQQVKFVNRKSKKNPYYGKHFVFTYKMNVVIIKKRLDFYRVEYG